MLATRSPEAVASPAREVTRPQLVEAGLFLVLVAAPLVVTPFTSSPFGDVKLVLVFGGTLCLWASETPVDRRIAALALVWFLATVVAALAGVEPLDGLLGQTNSTGLGAAFVAALGMLAAAGAAATPWVVERAARLLVGGGLAVAVIAIVFRVTPDSFETIFPGDALRGSTLGNPVFGAAFCAVAIASAVDTLSARRRLVVVAVLTFGCATFDERSALLLPVVSVIVTLTVQRPRRRDVIAVAAVVVMSVSAYLVVQPLLPPLGSSAVAQLRVAGERARLAVWDASFAGALERPVLGWGPSTTQTAFMRGADPSAIDVAGRGWGDAHNLVLEVFATTGLVGVASLLALAAVLARRAWRNRRSTPWAFAGTIVLAVFSLGEPTNVVTTPLLFLTAGLAAAGSSDALGRRPRTLGTVVIAVAVIASIVGATSATFERWGKRYGEVWAFERALDLQPWRVSAQRDLALRLSIDAGGGDRAAAAAARRLVHEAVRTHPWDGTVRLWAAQVEHLIGDDDAAFAWIDAHVERFPADVGIYGKIRRNLDTPALPTGPAGSAAPQP